MLVGFAFVFNAFVRSFSLFVITSLFRPLYFPVNQFNQSSIQFNALYAPTIDQQCAKTYLNYYPELNEVAASCASDTHDVKLHKVPSDLIVDLLRYNNFVVCYRVLSAADYITRNQE